MKVANIRPFEGHPFAVRDNKDMWDLVDSIKKFGVLEPVMVIPHKDGGYEMVSGHRRMRACQLAGIENIPVIVRNLDRDEAIISMVDSNLKREEISPMEKARAYQMKTDAMKRKMGRRTKEEIAQDEALGIKRMNADEELAQQMGESPATIQRYKTLNKLVPELQDLVDKGKIPVNTGADIAQMKPKEQKVLADAIQKEDKVPSGTKAKELKKESQAGSLTTEKIEQAVAPTKREETPPLKVTMLEEDLRPFFPDKRTTIPDVKQGILEGLKLRQTVMERQRPRPRRGKNVKKAETPVRVNRMSGKRMCQSYEIIDSRRVGNTEVVLGYSPTEVSPYVTWKCYAYDNFQGYNYGRYFGDEQAARKNMKQRVDELREELPPGHPDWKPRQHRKDPGMER